MWMWMPQAVQLLFVMGLWVMQGQAQLESVGQTAGAAGSATGTGSPSPSLTPSPSRNRIKAEADALMTGDSFNIRHGRSRSHFLHSNSSVSGGSGGIPTTFCMWNICCNVSKIPIPLLAFKYYYISVYKENMLLKFLVFKKY